MRKKKRDKTTIKNYKKYKLQKQKIVIKYGLDLKKIQISNFW